MKNSKDWFIFQNEIIRYMVIWYDVYICQTWRLPYITTSGEYYAITQQHKCKIWMPYIHVIIVYKTKQRHTELRESGQKNVINIKSRFAIIYHSMALYYRRFVPIQLRLSLAVPWLVLPHGRARPNGVSPPEHAEHQRHRRLPSVGRHPSQPIPPDAWHDVDDEPSCVFSTQKIYNMQDDICCWETVLLICFICHKTIIQNLHLYLYFKIDWNCEIILNFMS